MRSTTPRIEVDAAGFYAILRNFPSALNYAIISQTYYDTVDSFFRSHAEMLRLRSVQANGFQEQWDLRLKCPTQKTSDDSFLPNSRCALLPLSKIHKFTENPTLIMTDEDVPISIRHMFGRTSSMKLKKIGQIHTKRTYLTLNELLVKLDENMIEGGATFYTVGFFPNDIEKAKAEIVSKFQALGLAFSFSERTKYARMVGE
jgi:adenylate cyclase class IV